MTVGSKSHMDIIKESRMGFVETPETSEKPDIDRRHLKKVLSKLYQNQSLIIDRDFK